MQVFVQTLTGRQVAVDADLTDLIGDVKAKAQQLDVGIALPTSLMFAGAILEDSRSCGDCGLDNDAILQLVISVQPAVGAAVAGPCPDPQHTEAGPPQQETDTEESDYEVVGVVAQSHARPQTPAEAQPQPRAQASAVVPEVEVAQGSAGAVSGAEANDAVAEVIAICIDVSGSMRTPFESDRNRLEAVKQMFYGFRDQTSGHVNGGQHRLGLVSYDSRTTVHTKPTADFDVFEQVEGCGTVQTSAFTSAAAWFASSAAGGGVEVRNFRKFPHFRNFSHFPAVFRIFLQFFSFFSLSTLRACVRLRRFGYSTTIFPQFPAFWAFGFDAARPQSPPAASSCCGPYLRTRAKRKTIPPPPRALRFLFAVQVRDVTKTFCHFQDMHSPQCPRGNASDHRTAPLTHPHPHPTHP